jgi:hypothetical protein
MILGDKPLIFEVVLSQCPVRLFQSGLKTDGGTTTGGVRGTIAEVASESS